MTDNRSTVVGVFHDRDKARDAIEALKDAGFAAQDISILSPDKQATADIAEETGTHASSGAATGAVAGGILGGVGGWLVGIGALAIPGVGPFIAAGAFAAALGGAAIGAGVGAIAGALVGMGIPEEEAKYYESEVKSGRTLVTVRADGRFAEATQLLRLHGAYDMQSAGQTVGATRDLHGSRRRNVYHNPRCAHAGAARRGAPGPQDRRSDRRSHPRQGRRRRAAHAGGARHPRRGVRRAASRRSACGDTHRADEHADH